MSTWSLRNGRLAGLLLAARRGDRTAFRDLYRVLYGEVSRFVARRVQNATDAEDIVSGVFHRVVERLDRYDPKRGSVRAWVFTIARNAIIDHHRSRRDHAPLDDAAPALVVCPVDKLAHDEVARRVAALLEGCHADVREMFALRYGEGLRLREVADVLGMSEAAVKQRFSRTLRDLRERMRTPSSEVDYAT